jgi:unsaturated pyranuronate lyase
MPLIDTRGLPCKEPLPGWEGRFLNSENMTFAYYLVRAGAAVHEHDHPNEEVWNVVEGELEVTIAGETQVAGPGFVAVIPADTRHSVRALVDSRVIVVDYPARHAVGGVSIP